MRAHTVHNPLDPVNQIAARNARRAKENVITGSQLVKGVDAVN
ncbi:hypothetical protein LTSEALA_4398, partial [Salmonella enterica subsp. enterica serovar Alachua str. R6-377]